MTPPSLVVEGVSIQLGKRIGRGGEGEVFALENDVDRALKVYTASASDSHQREAKIAAIINRKIAQQSSLVAFPLAIARHSDGRFAGFVMKRVTGHKPLFELYSPGARKKHFPKADFRFLVRTAANISRAVASVHRTGCVIGDINHSGFLISEEARVALIDADSFQFIDGPQKFLCRVGVPEYTPPELQGKKLGGIVRTANHDAFGLAVVIFQLLFMGRHPFVGAFEKGDMPIERAIFEHRFAYSKKRNVGMTRPPGAASLADFPYEVAEAFEQAFSPHLDRPRPSAETWIQILEQLERSVTQCDKDNLHYYPAAAAECPWCRMEQQLGMLLFLPQVLNLSLPFDDPGSAFFNLATAWAAIEKVQLPNPTSLQPVLSLVECSPSEEAKRIKAPENKSRKIGIAILILAGIALICCFKFWYVWVALACFGGKKYFFKMDAEKAFLEKYFRARDQFEKAVQDWRTRCGITQVAAVKSSLTEARVQYQNLEREKQLRVALYHSNHRARHANQLQSFLESHEIRKAKIRHIGLARQTALASYGIETALDIAEAKVLAVPGFGIKNTIPLLEWRKSLEDAFVYDSKPNDMDEHEVKKIQFEVDLKGSELRKKLAAGAIDLSHAAHIVSTRAKKEDPIVTRAYLQYQCDKEDLAFLGLSISGTSRARKMKWPITARKASGKPTSIAQASGMQSSGRQASSMQPSGRQGSSPQSSSKQPSSTQSSSQSASRTAVLSKSPPVTSASAICCPRCGSSMVKRIARRGTPAEKVFYGCSTYPACRGARAI